MFRLERRSFLKATLAGMAGAANFLYPGITRAAALGTKSPIPSGASEATFAQGEVISLATGEATIDSGVKTSVVRFSPGTLVWKEFDVDYSLIQIGDWLDVARGSPMADGSILARSSWVFVNIARRDGTVAEVNSDALKLVDASGKVQELELSSSLEVVSAVDESPLPLQLGSIRRGDLVGVVGILLAEGRVRATRVWKHVP